jgi:hypothetical protein
MRLNSLNVHAKLGLSGFLLTIIAGVLSAVILIGLVYSQYDSGFRLSEVDKLKAKYTESLLVGAMKTSMYQHVADDEDITIVAKWVSEGSKNNDFFNDEVMYIIEADCQNCHSRTSTMTGAIPSMPLSSHTDILNYTEKGYSWTHMAKSAHTHLLGMAVFIVLVCFSMAFSSYKSWIKTGLIAAAWIGLWLDISSWWLAKSSELFVYLIMASGGLMVAATIAMCGFCLLDMWLKIPAFIRDEEK